MKMLRALPLLGALVLAQGTLAEEDKIIREPDQVRYKKETELDFSDVMVNGELMKPSTAYVKDRRGAHFNALIEYPPDFRKQLMATMGSL
jgi:hypothetical protein